MLKGFVTCSGPPASSIDSNATSRVLISRDDRVRVRDVGRSTDLGIERIRNMELRLNKTSRNASPESNPRSTTLDVIANKTDLNGNARKRNDYVETHAIDDVD